ncbi:MAG: hypothetical protein JWN71_874 [Xanthobacteraceae bacterium]|nr:hypothetical protein [Xanthobacteraceae bacterium]
MRRFAAIAAMLLLAACATATNTLKPGEVAKLKLTSVRVTFASDVVITWEDGVRGYAVANAITDDQIAMASNDPKAKEFVRNKLATRIRETLERNLRPHLAGSRPVRLEIVVQNFVISPAVQRIIIGGSHFMIADANLVDAATGATIVVYPKLYGGAVAGQGWAGAAVEAAIGGDQTERVLAGYSDTYRAWLFK